MTLGGLLVNRRTKQSYRLDGCRRSRAKPLSKLARPFLSLLGRQKLPNIVDLRPFLSPIEEQFTTGSCVGYALASILEYFHLYTTGHVKAFSRLFIYYNARMLEDNVSQRNATETDAGADIQFAIVSLMKYGCCEEKYWPFYEHLINIQPSYEAYKNGENYRLNEFNRLSNNINQLRECLAQGYPFIMAIKIFPSFASNHHGYIPMPKSRERSSQYRHAVVCVGYIHSERVFIIRNSHGVHWGRRGYGFIPYEYITDKVLTKDLWAIKAIENMTEISNEKQIAWNDASVLSRSMSRQDLTDDQSQCEIEYSGNNANGSDDDDDDDDDVEQEKSRLDNIHKQYYYDPSQESQRERSASAAPLDQHRWMQPPFINNFPVAYGPPPTVFMNVPNMGTFSHYPLMYAPTSFYRPF